MKYEEIEKRRGQKMFATSVDNWPTYLRPPSIMCLSRIYFASVSKHAPFNSYAAKPKLRVGALKHYISVASNAESPYIEVLHQEVCFAVGKPTFTLKASVKKTLNSCESRTQLPSFFISRSRNSMLAIGPTSSSYKRKRKREF